MRWFSENYRWLFDGVAGAAIIAVVGFLIHRFVNPKDQQQATLTAQGAKVENSPVASGTNITQTVNSPTIIAPTSSEEIGCEFWLQLHPAGSRMLRIQNSGAEPAFDVVVQIPADGSAFKSDMMHRVDNDRSWIPCTLNGAFVYHDSIRSLIAGIYLRGVDGIQEIPVLITYRNRKQQACEFHLEIRLPLQNGIQFALPRYTRSGGQVPASAKETERPLVIPVRYGAAPRSAGKHMMGHHGLVVANHGEPAYDVSVLTSEIQIGTSKLQLLGIRPTLTKADGDAFFKAGILESPGHGSLGDGLFDEMRKHHVAEIIVELIYKDAENRWYKTVGKIERDVMEPGGLSVRYIRREQTEQFDESTPRPDWPRLLGEYISVSSEAIPHFPATFSGFRPAGDDTDFWDKPFPAQGWIRLFEGNDWEGIPKFPNTMNGCSHGVFMIRWRSAHPQTLVRSSVRYSSKSKAGEKIGAFGYMSGTNCEQPMFKIVETPNGHTLVDLFYELKFWRAAP